MNAIRGIVGICVAICLMCSCHSEQTTRSSVPRPPAVASTNKPGNTTATKGCIQVFIWGIAVHEGWYNLPEGATVHDAIDVARKKGAFIDLREAYSGLERRTTDGRWQKMWPTNANRTIEEQLPLQNEDQLCLSHEHY
jgi:hypothetical protein